MDNQSEPSVHAESDDNSQVAMSAHLADDLLSTTAGGWKSFYNKLSRRLEDVGVADSSFFLNYGYLAIDSNNECVFDIPPGTFNASSVRLVLEVIGSVDLNGRTVVEIGCGRGGNSAQVAQKFTAQVTGIDMSSEAIAFCQKAHAKHSIDFKVGDALNLPLPDEFCDVVLNVESSHSYGNLPKFLNEVRRISRPGAWFLAYGLLGHRRLGLRQVAVGGAGLCHRRRPRHHPKRPGLARSCDQQLGEVYGDGNARVANFLSLPGSAIYEQMRAGLLEYRILRSQLRAS